MPSPLLNVMRNDGPRIFYDEGFRRELEVNIPTLKSMPYKQYQVEDNIALRYQYDFWGLLSYLDVPLQYHWIIMRFNDLASPQEYTKDKIFIDEPNIEYIETLRAIYTTSHNIV